MDHQKDFRVATNVNNILVTHAGLTDYFYNNYFDKEISDVREIANCLNGLPLSDFWQDASPLWYRPGCDYKPMSIRQIVGHTPPGWIERSGIELNNFVSVDPYSQEGFGPDRYRYALIENGEISIFDSNRK